MFAEQADILQQEIAEIRRIESLESFLIGGIKLLAAAIGEACALPGGHIGGWEPAVLPPIDQAGEDACRPALLVDIAGLQQLLQQPDLIVDVQDGEGWFQAYQFGMAAQDFHANGMESAEPRHP